MMKKASLILVLAALAGCAGQDCCKTYPDYPWGSYYWEGSRHFNPGDVWDDYYHDTGTRWRGQEGELPGNVSTGTPSTSGPALRQ